MFVEVFWQQEKLPKLIFLRFTNFNSSNNWSNSCQKRRENWLLFWHWFHITVTSYKMNFLYSVRNFYKINGRARWGEEAKKLTFEEVSWMAEKKDQPQQWIFLTIGSAFVFFFFFLSQNISNTFPFLFMVEVNVMEPWSKSGSGKKEDILLAKVKISLNGLNVCCVLILCTLK